MRFKSLIICLVFIYPSICVAQYVELGVPGGFSQYFGDLQPDYEARENNASYSGCKSPKD